MNKLAECEKNYVYILFVEDNGKQQSCKCVTLHSDSMFQKVDVRAF